MSSICFADLYRNAIAVKIGLLVTHNISPEKYALKRFLRSSVKYGKMPVTEPIGDFVVIFRLIKDLF